MFSVDLSTSEYGGHVVVALRGELDIAGASGVAAALAAAAARKPEIMVDLAGHSPEAATQPTRFELLNVQNHSSAPV